MPRGEPTQREVELECEGAELYRKLATAEVALRAARAHITTHCGEGQTELLKQITAALPPQPRLVCDLCGADRYKEDCRSDRLLCPMRGIATDA